MCDIEMSNSEVSLKFVFPEGKWAKVQANFLVAQGGATNKKKDTVYLKGPDDESAFVFICSYAVTSVYPGTNYKLIPSDKEGWVCIAGLGDRKCYIQHSDWVKEPNSSGVPHISD